MDWNTLRDELRKVSTLVDEWAQRDEIPAVERDLALEKLRKLYEAIRFAGVASAAADEASADGAEEQPESLDLGHVLSLDGFPGLDEPAGPIFVEPAGRVEPAAKPVAEPVAELAAGAVHEATPTDKAAATSPASRATEEALPRTESMDESGARASEPSGWVETLDVEPAVTLDPLPEPAERPRRGAPTLFGLEDDEELRHRHKQRVIMSLYDPSPEVGRVPSPSRRSESKQAFDQRLRPIERTPIDIEEPAAAPAKSAVGENPAEEPAVERAAENPAAEAPVSASVAEEPVEESVGAESAAATVNQEETPVEGVDDTVSELSDTEHTEAGSESEAGANPPSEEAFESGTMDVEAAAHEAAGVDEPAADEAREMTPAAVPEPETVPTEEAKPETKREGETERRPETETEPEAEQAGEAVKAESDADEAALIEEIDTTPIDVDSAFEELTVEPLSGEERIPDAESTKVPEPAESPKTEESAKAVDPSRTVRSPRPVHSGSERPAVRETLSEKFAEMQGSAVLGEVINHDVQTLADTITPPRDVASELRRSEPVADLRQAIGLNDRFLLIRDLFGGDAAACDRALDRLNRFEDLDDCMIFIAEHYAWNPNSDGAKLMMDLLERKFA